MSVSDYISCIIKYENMTFNDSSMKRFNKVAVWAQAASCAKLAVSKSDFLPECPSGGLPPRNWNVVVGPQSLHQWNWVGLFWSVLSWSWDWAKLQSLPLLQIHCNFCTPHAASYRLRTGIYLWQELGFLNYVWHACSQVWSIYPFPGINSWIRWDYGPFSKKSNLVIHYWIQEVLSLVSWASHQQHTLVCWSWESFITPHQHLVLVIHEVTGIEAQVALPSSLIWMDCWFNNVTANMAAECLPFSVINIHKESLHLLTNTADCFHFGGSLSKWSQKQQE